MSTQKSLQASRHRSSQVLLALFSVIFIAVIAYGYYHLLSTFGWFGALLGSLLISSFAWYLARVVGTGEGGMKRYWFLFIPLFIVSAAGVYNTLMVYLEGSQVLTDTATESHRRFGLLEKAARSQLSASGVAERVNRVESLRDALFSEIRNPLNCGQGPEARRLIAELQRELPDFKPLSGPKQDCSQNSSVLDDYRVRINSLVARAPWSNPDLVQVVDQSAIARRGLTDLKTEISKSYEPTRIHQIAGIFEGFQSTYQTLRDKLGSGSGVGDLPDSLSITAAQSLGNVAKLPALFFSRLGEASTYVYLLVAFGFDILLVYLFELATRTNVRRPSIAGPIAGAW